jgi:methylglutaconyl-CoA hydratase
MYTLIYYACWLLIIVFALVAVYSLSGIVGVNPETGGAVFSWQNLVITLVFGASAFLLWRGSDSCRVEYNYTFTNGNLIFAGWNTKPDGSGVSYTNCAKITPVENMTLYAQWAKKITVSYYKNDETSLRFVASDPSNTAFNLRTLAQLEESAQRNGKTFLRAGYEFVGWSLTPDAAPDDPGIIQDGAEVTFEDDTTLYAIWREEVVHWWPVSFMISTESTGTGTVVMKYGNTQLTASSQIKDSNGNIIIKGNGKSFCAGADLAYMKEMAEFSYEQNVADAERLSKLFRTIYFCNKAVITVVHGACIGGANGIIAAADIVIAESSTKFAFSEVRLGITPATISPFVVQKIGNTAAKELMLTGRLFSAEEAKDFKLVNVVTDESQLVDVERQYIDHFMHASPDAVAECKNLLRLVSGTNDPFASVFHETATLIANQRISKAGQEGMASFFEKRKPEWLS